MTETSKVFKSGRAEVTAIPVLIRKNLNIQTGDYLEWELNNKTDELNITVVRADEKSDD